METPLVRINGRNYTTLAEVDKLFHFILRIVFTPFVLGVLIFLSRL